jgi:hypothetical protein
VLHVSCLRGTDPTDIADIASPRIDPSASLLHDDTLTAARPVEGRPLHFIIGLANSLVAGDFLFSQAFGLCGRFEEVSSLGGGCLYPLTEGEVMGTPGTTRRLRETTTLRLFSEDRFICVRRTSGRLHGWRYPGSSGEHGRLWIAVGMAPSH